MKVQLDADADDAYSNVPLPVAHWADEVFDWLEESPVNVRARARRFTNGLWAVTRVIGGDDWLILWEPDGEIARVRHLGQDIGL